MGVAARYPRSDMEGRDAGMTYCVDGDIAAFAEGEGLVLAAIPHPEDVDAAWCLRFLRAIRDVAFATVDTNGLPSVRIIDVMAVTDRRLYFLAPRGKEFHVDVMREKFVAIVGQTPDYRTCRFRGRVVHPEGEAFQRALVDAIFELNPSMNLLYSGENRYICDVFYVEEGEGEYFDLGQSPVFRKPFRIGGEPDVRGTFLITDACIGCGACAAACPEQCIAEGDPYVIDQSHCLRCGICQEVCSVQAIVKR